LLGWFSSSV